MFSAFACCYPAEEPGTWLWAEGASHYLNLKRPDDDAPATIVRGLAGTDGKYEIRRAPTRIVGGGNQDLAHFGGTVNDSHESCACRIVGLGKHPNEMTFPHPRRRRCNRVLTR